MEDKRIPDACGGQRTLETQKILTIGAQRTQGTQKILTYSTQRNTEYTIE